MYMYMNETRLRTLLGTQHISLLSQHLHKTSLRILSCQGFEAQGAKQGNAHWSGCPRPGRDG